MTMQAYIIRKKDLELARDIAMNRGDTPAALRAIRALIELQHTPTTSDGRADRTRA